MSEPGLPPRTSRIDELDGVRGVAIALVLYYHFYAQSPHQWLIARIFGQLVSVAWGGVDLFFVLSGFLIGGILLDHLRSPNLLKVFYTRRALRIFPLYYAWVLLGILLQTCFRNVASVQDEFTGHLHWWYYLTHLQNIGYAIKGTFASSWFSLTWSLAVEEQFYLLLPGLLLILKPRVVLWISAAAIPLTLLLRWVINIHGGYFACYVLLPTRVDTLLVGVIAAWGYRQPSIMAWVRNHQALLHIAFITMLVLCYLQNRFFHGIFGTAFIFTLLELTSLLFILLAITSRFRGWLRTRWLMRLGNIAYGVYLMQFGLVHLFMGAAGRNAWIVRMHLLAPILVLSIAGVLCVASISFLFFESPLIRLGHRHRYLPAVGGDHVSRQNAP